MCIHKYKLKDIARKGNEPYLVYICTKQDCTHNIKVELVDGKAATCNRCDNPFVINYRKIKTSRGWMKLPHCEACTWEPRNPEHKKTKRAEV